MTSCSCCLVDNGRNNIILEIVTASISGFFVVVELLFSRNIFSLVLDFGPLLAAVLGIAALKNPRKNFIGQVAVGVAIVTIVLYCILAFLMIIGFSMVFTIFKQRVEEDSDGLTPDPNTAAAAKAIFGVLIAVIVVYVLFGIGTSTAIAVKHWRICKSRRPQTTATAENPPNMEVRYLHYIPPNDKEQQLQGGYQFPNPSQPGQPPVGNIYFNPQCDPAGFRYNPQGQLQQTWNFGPNCPPPPPPPPPPGLESSYNPLQGQSAAATSYYVPGQQPQPPPYEKCTTDQI